jgi:hypothetical protein
MNRITRGSTSQLTTLARSKQTFNDLTLFKEVPIDIHQNNGEIMRNTCWAGSYEILKYIVETYPGINIHRKNENAFKGTCLGDHNNIEMAKLLLEHFPHINIHIDNDYIFKTACERNLLPVIELYIDRCPTISYYEDLNTSYLMAFKYHHRSIIDRLNTKYSSLLKTNYLDALYLSCEKNYLDLVQLLFEHRSDNINYDYIFSLDLNDDLFLWLYAQGYYNLASAEVQKSLLYGFIKKDHIIICRTILGDHKEFCTEIVNFGTNASYDISYTIYKIVDLNYLTEAVCTQAIKYCLKHNLIEDCRILMDQPNTITKLDVKMFCYENDAHIIKSGFYEIVEVMTTKNLVIKKMYFETLSYNIRKCYLTDDVDSFIFFVNKYSEVDRYNCFVEACRCNSLKIVQCLCRALILGQYRIPQDISTIIISVALKEGHSDIIQYLYTTYSDYSNITPKEIPLGYNLHKDLSPNTLTNLMWLIWHYPNHKKKFETIIWTRNPTIKMLDQRCDEVCMICKIGHDTIIKLPCGHYICFEQICHFRVEAGVHNICLGCRKEYSWDTCIMYNGKKSKFFSFR